MCYGFFELLKNMVFKSVSLQKLGVDFFRLSRAFSPPTISIVDTCKALQCISLLLSSFFSLLCLCSEQAFLISIMVHSWCNNILTDWAEPTETRGFTTALKSSKVLHKHIYSVLCANAARCASPSQDQYETALMITLARTPVITQCKAFVNTILEFSAPSFAKSAIQSITVYTLYIALRK